MTLTTASGRSATSCKVPSAHHDFLFAVMRSSFDTLVSVDASNRRHRHCSTKREGPACPDSFVVVGTWPRSHLQIQQRANRDTNTACNRVGSSSMQHSATSVASQKTSRDDMQYSPRGEPNSIAVSSLFAIFVTSVCIACACVSDADLICLAFRCKAAHI